MSRNSSLMLQSQN